MAPIGISGLVNKHYVHNLCQMTSNFIEKFLIHYIVRTEFQKVLIKAL